MENDLFKKMVTIIKDNRLRIEKKTCYDPCSGRTGTDYKVYDGNKFITNLSGNGYCFDNTSITKSYNEIKEYIEYKNLSNIESFRKWVENNAVEIL